MVATKAAMPRKAMIVCHEVSTGANHSRKKQQARKKADPAHWIGFRPTTSTAAIISTVSAQTTTSVSIGIQRSQQCYSRLTPCLTYRRRGGKWSAEKIYKSRQSAERKARAAVRCRHLVGRTEFHDGLPAAR